MPPIVVLLVGVGLGWIAGSLYPAPQPLALGRAGPGRP